MGVRFSTDYVYIIDKNNDSHFVMNHYRAKFDDSYRSDIYLENKSYCVLDLYLTDEVEAEGEYLPSVKEKEWREFLSVGPSVDASTILSEAGLADISISKLVFVHLESSSGSILDVDGFVSSVAGAQDFDEEFLGQAVSFACTQTGSPAEQEPIVGRWIVEQVQNGNFTSTK